MTHNQQLRVTLFIVLIAVFGMSLFSCQSREAELSVHQVQRIVSKVNTVDDRLNSAEQARLIVSPEERIVEVGSVREEQVLELYNEDVIHQLEEITIEEYYRENEMRMLGAMMISEYATEYLVQEILDPIVRYDQDGLPIPQEYGDMVYPNPTVGTATYKLELPEDGIFVCGLYDMSGRHLRNLYEGSLEAGTHEFSLNLIDEQPGTFLVVTSSKNFSNSQRIIKI